MQLWSWLNPEQAASECSFAESELEPDLKRESLRGRKEGRETYSSIESLSINSERVVRHRLPPSKKESSVTS